MSASPRVELYRRLRRTPTTVHMASPMAVGAMALQLGHHVSLLTMQLAETDVDAVTAALDVPDTALVVTVGDDGVSAVLGDVSLGSWRLERIPPRWMVDDRAQDVDEEDDEEPPARKPRAPRKGGTKP